MIAHDLWPTIVDYLGPEYYKKLSEASVMFDEVLYHMGIKVFYDVSIAGINAYIIEDTDMLIRLRDGKMFLLRYYPCIYRTQYTIVNSSIIRFVYESIISYDHENVQKRYMCVDPVTGIAIADIWPTVICTNYKPNIRSKVYVATITNKIQDYVTNISLDSRIAMCWSSTTDDRMAIQFEDFTVICKNGKWCDI